MLTVGAQLSADRIVVYVMIPLLGLFGFTGVVCTITYRRRRYVRRGPSPTPSDLPRRDCLRPRSSPQPSMCETTESELIELEQYQQHIQQQYRLSENDSTDTVLRVPQPTAHGFRRSVTRSQTTEHRALLA